MIAVELKEALRRAVLVEHRRIREVSRQFHVSRKTIRQALHDASPPVYRRKTPARHPVLDPVIPWIDGVLEADRVVHRKQRHTALRIWQRLRDEQAFTGGASTVREYVHQWKKLRGPSPAVFVPIEHPPGRDAEVDWGEAQVVIAGVPTTAQLFVGRLSSSGKSFVMAFPHQRQEAFLTGHVGAFAFWGGVPHRLRYDNLKTAVLKVLTGRKRQEQDAFVAFRSHHLYEASFCTPGLRGAHEKGGVEGGVGYARRHFFVPIPEADSFDHLNALLLERLIADGGRLPAGKSESIDAAFERERPLLLPLPRHPYDCCRRIEARVSSSSLVTFEGNRYSVPVGFAFRIVSVKAYVHEVHVAAGDAIVARHPRRYGHSEESLDPLHYLPLLARSPGAFEFGKPFQGWTLPPAFDRLRALAGSRALIRVLQEIPSHGLEAVREAVERTLSEPVPTPDAVLRRLDPLRPPRRFDLSDRPALAALSVPVVPCSRYNQLLS